MLEFAAAALALAFRAVLQAAEAGLLALGEDETREAGEKSHTSTRARLLLDLKENAEPTAAAVRAASGGLLAFAAVICAVWVGNAFPRFPALSRASQLPLQILAGLLAGAAALVFDLAPRSLAAARPLPWALALAWPTWLVCRALRPPTRLLLFFFDKLLVRRGATARYTPPPPPLEQIEKILSEEARSGGSAPPPEMVHGLFAFAGRQAKEVMVPRTHVVGVPVEASAQQVADLLAEEGHTRMPVYEGDLDHIVGVLHAKDVIPLLANPALIVLHDLLRQPLWVPWNMPVIDLLKEMQHRRSHLALVVDEYGGFAGVVSIEDILSEIVGDLPEEHEAPAPRIKLGPDGSATLPAETRLGEVNEVLAAGLPDDQGFETLGGLLNSMAGAIPQAGDRFYVGGWELTVAQRDDRRVRLVRLVRSQSIPPAPRT